MSGQKKMLALDGGGILGAISVQVLRALEDQLREAHGAGPEFRLRDYFDYVAGTSTGAVLAAGIAVGKSAEELHEFYLRDGVQMFQKEGLLKRWRHTYKHAPLTEILKREFHGKTIAQLQDMGILSKDKHLLIVTRNVETDSPWPISTNPAGKYNDRSRADCNLNIPLWQLVRASTAAPTYFAPEFIQWDPNDPDKHWYFEDGGVTPYNSPAMLMYRMATLPQYNCCWDDGEDKMMIISIGTGNAYRELKNPNPGGEGLLATASSIPSELLRGMATENDIACRTIGRCVSGPWIDNELGDMVPTEPVPPRRFLYARYDFETSQKSLEKAGMGDIRTEDLTMDNVAAVEDMVRVGKAAAQAVDLRAHFPSFLPGVS